MTNLAGAHDAMSEVVQQDKEQAKLFLQRLDTNEEVFSFHCFDPEDKLPARANIVGTIDDRWPELCENNNEGYGVYVAVNAVSGDRKKKNVVRVRAIWQEDDDHFNGDLPLDPSMVVNTSPGKYHRYFTTLKTVDEDIRHEFDEVLRCMIERYGSDPNAKDISRVLRVPGFFNTKPDLPKRHLVKVTNGTGERYPWNRITNSFRPPPRPKRKPVDTESTADLEEALDALDAIDPAVGRQDWINIGTGLKGRYGDSARGHWINWSIRSTNPEHNDTPAQLSRQWDSFDPSAGANIETLFYHAYGAGWSKPIGENNQFPTIPDNSQHSRHQESDSRQFPDTNPDTPDKSWGEVAKEVRMYVEGHDADVSIGAICQALGLNNRSLKQRAYDALRYMAEQGNIKKHSTKRDVYIRTNKKLRRLKPKADKSVPLALPLPLDLHNEINMKGGSVIVIGGATNAGKTLLAMEFLRRWVPILSGISGSPLYTHNSGYSLRSFSEYPAPEVKRLSKLTGIRYLTSEMEDEELGDLLSDLGPDGKMLEEVVEWVFQNKDYPSAILKDGITFVDFLQIHREFYEIGEIIKEMADEVGNGILVVFIQKRSGESFPRGGEFSMERARIAMLLDYAGPNISSCYLKKVKYPKNRQDHPQFKEMEFTFDHNLRPKPVSSLRRLNDKERKNVYRGYGAGIL